MADKAKEAVSPDRLDNVKKAIADSRRRVDELKADRAALNEDIASIRADMVTKGIPKAAFDMALRYMGWDEDKREGFDLAYSICREAMGAPVDAQGDLFADLEPEDEASARSAALHEKLDQRDDIRARSDAEVAEGEAILAAARPGRKRLRPGGTAALQ